MATPSAAPTESRYLPLLFTLFACLPRAVRVRLGRREIVFFLRAATAAFLMFRLAADFCLVLAMAAYCCRPSSLPTGGRG
jgi:hypothetical protein